MVAYTSGRHVESDFLAVKLHDGRLSLTVNKGSGRFTLRSPVYVNDSTWHKVGDISSILYLYLNYKYFVE